MTTILADKAKLRGAIWALIWLSEHVTDQDGNVENAKPISTRRIARELGDSRETLLIHLRRLSSNGYIDRRLSKVGHAYTYRVIRRIR